MRSTPRKFVALAVTLLLLAASGCGFVAASVREAADPPGARVEKTTTKQPKATKKPKTEATKPARKPKSCLIKGNISTNTGERIYHVPGQQYYDVTVINEAYGERWFCSEAEARSAGWRKSKV